MKGITANLIFCLLIAYQTQAQKTISGKVIAADDSRGVPGVSVKVGGQATGTLTDQYGKYEIAVSEEGATLVFSKAGFAPQEMAVGLSLVVNVVLSREQAEDTEAIPVGYGELSRDELTGSVSQINAGEISAQPVIELEQANQGKAAGVFIQNNSGKLGEGTTVRIRGGSSLTASNEPLYIVDGVPLTSGSHNDLNPSNIASMEVLKDASAAAIYGSRAANGVILITTKSGKAGKLKVEADYQFGVSQTPKYLDLYSPADFNRQVIENELRFAEQDDEITYDKLVQWEKEARELHAQYPDSVFYILTTLDGKDFYIPVSELTQLKYGTDWQREIFRTALSHRANLSLSGGTKAHQLFASASYTTQEGILVGNNFERFNARLGINSSFTDKLSTNLSLNYSRTTDHKLNEDQDLGSPLQAIALPPSDGYDPNNNYNLLTFGDLYNPLTEIHFSDNVETGNSLIGNLGINYELASQLTLNMDGGIEYLASRWERRQGPQTQDGKGTGFSRLTETNLFNYILNGYLDYQTGFGAHEVSAVLGSSYQQSSGEITFRSARVNSIAELESLGAESPDLLNPPVPGSASAFLSFFSRINYVYAGRYILQLSGRADGSSSFGPSNRYGFFPAVSAGWNISEESFLENNSTVSFLKLKAGYGMVGNTPADDFLYRANYNTINYGSQTGIRLANLSNSNLKWENTAQLDVGLEFGLFNDRISGTVDYYIKSTTDLLIPTPVSQTSGFAFVLKNGGALENRGLELSLNTLNVSAGDFSWGTDFNIAFNENKVTDIGGRPLIVGVNAYIEGESPGVFYMPEYKGVDVFTGEALYDDGNGGTTADYDLALEQGRKVVGDPNPDYFGGLQNTIRYKNLDLSFLFQFVGGVDLYYATGEFLANSGIQGLSQLADQNDRWYSVGDEAPNSVYIPNNINTNPSSRWMQEGDYIRLKSVNLTFSFPDAVVSNWGLGYLKIYVGGSNLLTFTDYIGYDPDVNYVDPQGGTIERNINRGIDNFTAPQARTITSGIKIGF